MYQVIQVHKVLLSIVNCNGLILRSGLAVDFGAMWLHGGTNVNHPLTKLCLKFGIPVVHHDEGRSDMIFTYDLHGGKYTDAEFEAIESVSKVRMILNIHVQ